MADFRGFSEGKSRLIPIPEQFFAEVLPQIDDLDELKVLLFAFRRLEREQGAFRYLKRDNILEASIIQGLAGSHEEWELKLDASLERLVRRGVLLKASVELGKQSETLYFLNSPKGRAAIGAIQRGEWRPTGDQQEPLEIAPEPPNIFRLYEEHIGLLTPMIAEALREAEQTYPAEWVEEAMRIAVEKNARNWRYVAAILKKWKEEGKVERKGRQDTEKARRRYAEWENPDSARR
jgi:DnaD/phage-associated family protein